MTGREEGGDSRGGGGAGSGGGDCAGAGGGEGSPEPLLCPLAAILKVGMVGVLILVDETACCTNRGQSSSPPGWQTSSSQAQLSRL